MTPRLRFGLIACSTVARRRFLPALCAADNASLARIGSRSPDRAAVFAHEFACAKFGSYEDVLRDPDVDAVYVSTPSALHAEGIVAAARHGKHVLCEKPACVRLSEAQKSVAQCRQHGVRLLEGYMFKYHPQHAAVRRLLEEGRIGAVRCLRATFTYPRPADGDIRLDVALGGGVFSDAAGYPVAAARMLLGEPTSVGCTLELDASARVDCGVAMQLHFGDNAIAQIYTGFGLHYTSHYDLIGAHGRIELGRAFAVPPETQTSARLETSAGAEIVEIEPADQFRLMIEDFVNVVRGEREHDYEGDLLAQQRVMEAARRAAQEKRIVVVAEAM